MNPRPHPASPRLCPLAGARQLAGARRLAGARPLRVGHAPQSTAVEVGHVGLTFRVGWAFRTSNLRTSTLRTVDLLRQAADCASPTKSLLSRAMLAPGNS